MDCIVYNTIISKVYSKMFANSINKADRISNGRTIQSSCNVIQFNFWVNKIELNRIEQNKMHLNCKQIWNSVRMFVYVVCKHWYWLKGQQGNNVISFFLDSIACSFLGMQFIRHVCLFVCNLHEWITLKWSANKRVNEFLGNMFCNDVQFIACERMTTIDTHVCVYVCFLYARTIKNWRRKKYDMLNICKSVDAIV